MTEKMETGGEAAKKTAAAKPVQVRCKVLKTGTAALGFIHAAGAVLTLDKDKADALVAAGLGEITGV